MEIKHKNRIPFFSNNYKVEDWCWGDLLGEGHFGQVQYCWLKKDKRQQVAIKAMKKQEIIDIDHVDLIKNEKKVLEQLDHPFIMNYYGFMQDDRYIYFISEYLQGGELFSHHRKRGNFNERETAFYGSQIVSIFEYLHNKNIIYRDLKPENIMVNNDGYLSLIDFGFAKKLMRNCQRTYTICGTPEYIAPEIVLNQGYGKSADWWTLGILLYEMMNGQPPFYDDDPLDIYMKILNTKPRFPTGFDPKLKSLIKHLLRRNHLQRFGCSDEGANEIKNHRFFEDINFDDLLKKKLKPPIIPQTKNLKQIESNKKNNKLTISPKVSPRDDPFVNW